MELTILMPCLNEEETIGRCIEKALHFIKRRHIYGEVLVVDNGSTDTSKEIALHCGARVVECLKQGYGNALRYGISEAKGSFFIMGDCDLSYDFENLDGFWDAFIDGYEFVIGNRMQKKMEKGAMSFSHRYIGVPFLSLIGRMRYHTQIRDFHCGLRGMDTQKARDLSFQSEGMEFASEMIGKVVKQGLRIKEIPITLYKDGRKGPSHLHTIRDGFRHLGLLLKNDK